MATARGLLARLGLRIAAAGTSAALALSVGTTRDAAARIGLYADTTGGTEKLGLVVGGVAGATVVSNGSDLSLIVQTGTRDGIALAPRGGGSSSYLATLTTAALPASVTYTFPASSITVAGSNIAQTWSATQTFAAIDATSIGATTRGTALFTTIGANSTAQFSADVFVTNSNGISTNSTTNLLRLSGGSVSDGAVILLGGSAHASVPNQGQLRIATTAIVTWTSSLVTTSQPLTISTSTAIGTPTSTQVFLGNGRGYFGNTGATSIQTAGGITAAGNLVIGGTASMAFGSTFFVSAGAGAATATSSAAAISHTGSTGSAPYDQAGSLVYQTRLSDTTGRSTHYFLTGASGLQRLKITELGNIVCGNAAIATTATDAFLYVPSCAGTPTGTPTAYTGRVPIVVDSTNNKLYFYSGGAWRDAGP